MLLVCKLYNIGLKTEPWETINGGELIRCINLIASLLERWCNNFCHVCWFSKIQKRVFIVFKFSFSFSFDKTGLYLVLYIVTRIVLMNFVQHQKKNFNQNSILRTILRLQIILFNTFFPERPECLTLQNSCELYSYFAKENSI